MFVRNSAKNRFTVVDLNHETHPFLAVSGMFCIGTALSDSFVFVVRCFLVVVSYNSIRVLFEISELVLEGRSFTSF